MTTNLDHLESLARAATPGPWEAAYDGLVLEYEVRDYHDNLCAKVDFGNVEANAAYIAAANPQIVLELIAELRQTRAEREWLARNLAMVGATRIMHPNGGDEPNCTYDVGPKKCFQCWLKAAREAVAAQAAVMEDAEEVADEIARRDK